MKKPMILLVLLVFSALPALAQTSHEFGILVGAARRTLEDNATEDSEDAFLDDGLRIANSSVELYYGLKLDDDTILKIKAGRIETPVRYITRETVDGNGNVTETFAADAEGEVQHIDALIEYRFHEAYGTTGLFGGLGLYRQSSSETETTSDFGFQFGVNADFPLSRKAGVILEAAYHWTRAEFRPKYLTIGGGVRFSF